MTFSCVAFAPRRTKYAYRDETNASRLNPSIPYSEKLMAVANRICNSLRKCAARVGNLRKAERARAKKPCDVSFTPSFCLRDSLPTDPVKKQGREGIFHLRHPFEWTSPECYQYTVPSIRTPESVTPSAASPFLRTSFSIFDF